MRKAIFLLCAATVLACAADKNARTASTGAENDHVEIQATIWLDKEDITKAVGMEIPPGIAVMAITVIPHGDEPLSVGRDDFTLVSHHDGQRSQPFAPSQIAGTDVMVVTQHRIEGGDMMTQNKGPVWGGTMGRPRQMPGSGGGIGNSGSQTGAEATVKTSDDNGKPNPLLDKLRATTLPDSKETKEPLKGLLYFPLDGKQKPKDLELLYKGPAGRLNMEFDRRSATDNRGQASGCLS